MECVLQFGNALDSVVRVIYTALCVLVKRYTHSTLRLRCTACTTATITDEENKEDADDRCRAP